MDLPIFWWDEEADKSLLVGVFKHGYEKYNLMRNDPCLCFLSRCGAPDERAVLAEQNSEAEELRLVIDFAITIGLNCSFLTFLLITEKRKRRTSRNQRREEGKERSSKSLSVTMMTTMILSATTSEATGEPWDRTAAASWSLESFVFHLLQTWTRGWEGSLQASRGATSKGCWSSNKSLRYTRRNNCPDFIYLLWNFFLSFIDSNKQAVLYNAKALKQIQINSKLIKNC